MRFVFDLIPKYTDDGENIPAYKLYVTKSQLFCYIHYSYHSDSLYWSFAWIYVNYFGTCFICNHLKPLSFDKIYQIEQYNDCWSSKQMVSFFVGGWSCYCVWTFFILLRVCCLCNRIADVPCPMLCNHHLYGLSNVIYWST